MVLRVTVPEVLQALRASRAARYLGEPLSPTAVAIKPGAGAEGACRPGGAGLFGGGAAGE